MKINDINKLLKNFCHSHNMKFTPIELRDVSLKEIYNKEIKVKFMINKVLIEEYIELYIDGNSLDILKDVLQHKYSMKESKEIKDLLKETDF